MIQNLAPMQKTCSTYFIVIPVFTFKVNNIVFDIDLFGLQTSTSCCDPFMNLFGDSNPFYAIFLHLNFCYSLISVILPIKINKIVQRIQKYQRKNQRNKNVT